jgi:ankyrin repeat protein
MSFYDRTSHNFVVAARRGDLELTKKLSLDPEVDVNYRDFHVTQTAFYAACKDGHTEVVHYLLCFKKVAIEYNADDNSWTPFMSACYNGHEDVVRMLLDDKRISIEHANSAGETSLWLASEKGNINIVKLLLASPRIQYTTQTDMYRKMTAAEIAKDEGHEEISVLLESFEMEPERTREQLREELGYPTESAELFALIVYLSDEYLKIKEEE